jgi:hypothetical protein
VVVFQCEEPGRRWHPGDTPVVSHACDLSTGAARRDNARKPDDLARKQKRPLRQPARLRGR